MDFVHKVFIWSCSISIINSSDVLLRLLVPFRAAAVDAWICSMVKPFHRADYRGITYGLDCRASRFYVRSLGHGSHVCRPLWQINEPWSNLLTGGLYNTRLIWGLYYGATRLYVRSSYHGSHFYECGFGRMHLQCTSSAFFNPPRACVASDQST